MAISLFCFLNISQISDGKINMKARCPVLIMILFFKMVFLILFSSFVTAEVDSKITLIDDFEGNNKGLVFNTERKEYTDVPAAGTSAIEVAVGNLIENHSKPDQPIGRVLKVKGSFGTGFGYPFFGLRIFLAKDEVPMDLSGYKGILVKLQNTSDFSLQVLTIDVTDFNEFSYNVVAGDEWKVLKIPFSDFKQNAYFGKQVDFSLKGVKGLAIHLIGAPGSNSGTVTIDEIGFYH